MKTLLLMLGLLFAVMLSVLVDKVGERIKVLEERLESCQSGTPMPFIKDKVL